MSERIQRALDGDIPRGELGSAELAELETYEEAMDRALAGLRSEAEPDLTDPVMRRLGRLPDPAPGSERDGPLSRWWAALWRSRSITVDLRPAYGMVVAALVAAFVLGPWWPGRAGEGTDPQVAGADAAVLVHFRLEAPDAQQVELAGDFTGWEPRYALNQIRDGVWSVVVPVRPGVHQYGFLIDGQRWRVDPFAPQVDDGFGGANSRLDVLAQPSRSL